MSLDALSLLVIFLTMDPHSHVLTAVIAILPGVRGFPLQTLMKKIDKTTQKYKIKKQNIKKTNLPVQPYLPTFTIITIKKCKRCH